jgi:SulP family sulfate permease
VSVRIGAYTDRRNLVSELWGGFAAMLVAVPSAVAYGVSVYGPLGGDSVARGVRAGILGAIAMGLVAPALGGTPRLISAPCAPAAAVLAALVLELRAGTGAISPDWIAALLALVAVMSAGLQLLYGMIAGGRLIKYIPYPVVSGLPRSPEREFPQIHPSRRHLPHFSIALLPSPSRRGASFSLLS